MAKMYSNAASILATWRSMTRSPRMRRSPNGITAKAARAKKTEKKGAKAWRDLSAPAGTISSLVNILITSATPWSVPSNRKPKMSCAGGPDSVLDEGGLLPLHPGMKPRQVQSREKDDAGQHQLYQQNLHHGATPGASFGRG